MRRALPHAVRQLSNLSLLLCVLTAGVWAWGAAGGWPLAMTLLPRPRHVTAEALPSAIRVTYIRYQAPPRPCFPDGNPFSGSNGGSSMQIGIAPRQGLPDRLIRLEQFAYDETRDTLRAQSVIVTYRPEQNAAGVWLRRGLTSGGPVNARVGSVALAPWLALDVPYFYLVALLAIRPVVGGVAWVRGRRARRRGLADLCTACGYDLRASRQYGRCPECGEPVRPARLTAAAPASAATNPAPAPAPAGARTRHLAAAAGCVLLLAVSLVLYTRHNDFPFHYHPHEKFKAFQVVNVERNFHDPLLLLETCQTVAYWLDTPRDLQPTVELARSVSAAFAALAVAVLAVLGYRVAGAAGLVLAGLTVALCPPLLVHAHYLEEDATLVFGLCLTLLAAATFLEARRPIGRRLAVVFLGAACGLAASAKYSGIYAILVVLPFVWFAGRNRWYFSPAARALALLATFGLVVCAVNWRVFGTSSSALFRRSLGEQWREGTSHAVGLVDAPNAMAARAAASQCGPLVLLLAVAFCAWAAWAAATRRARWPAFAALFAAGYLLMLCWSVNPSPRYALPVVVLAYFFAATAVATVAAFVGRRWHGIRSARWAMPALFAAFVLATQLPRCVRLLARFDDDARLRLRRWVAANLPADAIVAQDPAACLDDEQAGLWAGRWQGQSPWHDGEVPVPCRVMTPSVSATELGVVSKLRRRGITHVAVTDAAYRRYFDPAVRPNERARAEYMWRRGWYEELFRDHDLLWEHRPPDEWPVVTDPGLRLYRLREPSAAAREPGAGRDVR